MESNWGRNVSDYGCAGMRATLCGINFMSPGLVVCLLNNKRAGHFSRVEIRPDTDLPYVIQQIAPAPGHPNFPYGFHVAPWSPV